MEATRDANSRRHVRIWVRSGEMFLFSLRANGSHEAENEQPPACQPTGVEEEELEEEEEHMTDLVIISHSSAFKNVCCLAASGYDAPIRG